MKKHSIVALSILLFGQIAHSADSSYYSLSKPSTLDQGTPAKEEPNAPADDLWNYGLDEKVTPLLEQFNKHIRDRDALMRILRQAIETLNEKELKHFLTVAKNNIKMEEQFGFHPGINEYLFDSILVSLFGDQHEKALNVIKEYQEKKDEEKKKYEKESKHKKFVITLLLRDGKEAVSFLKERPELINAPVDTGEGFGSQPPIFYFGNSIETIKELEKLGASIYIDKDKGYGLLSCATSSCSMPVAKYLIEEKGFPVSSTFIELAKKNRCQSELITYLEKEQQAQQEKTTQIRK